MAKSTREKSIKEIVVGALGMRPKKGWTASELDAYVCDRYDIAYSYNGLTALLSNLVRSGVVRRLGKRQSEVTNSTSYAYTRA